MTSTLEPIYGQLPKEWEFVSLSDLISMGYAELQTGPFGTMLHASSYCSVGTPVIAVLHIGDNRVKHNDLPLIDSSTLERLKKYKVKKGDILFARKGAVERRALVSQEEEGWIQGSDCIRLRISGDFVLPEFISYVMGTTAYKEWILRHAHGATMPSLNQEILGLVPIPIPPINYQKAVIDVFQSLDNKIHLNHCMNATLEEIARTIFKSWFVDFDPVRAKAEGCDPGLSSEVADLFPESFDESPLGEIPKGWKVVPLDEIAHFLNGLACQKYPVTDGEDYFNVIKIAELRRGITESSDRATKLVPKEYIVQDGDILFSWSGSLEVCIWTGGEGLLNQHLFKVSSKNYPKWFYYLWTLFYLPEFRAIASDKATTMGHIQRYHLTNSLVVVPHQEVLQATDKLLSPMIEKIIINGGETKNLINIRDQLLPRLMSGELYVGYK